MTVKEYLQRKNTLLNTTAIIRDGKHYRLHNDQLIEESKFRKMYQLPVSLRYSYTNPDNRKKYLGV